MKVSDVEFVKELYPRLREDDAAIERYRAAVDKLPPITVARGRILVDGFHRWQAHKREGIDDIAADDLGNLADAEILRESIQRNASHGQQLSIKDKESLAPKLWVTYAHLDGGRTAEIASLLSVDDRSVQRWTKDVKAMELAARKARAWDLWLDCQSFREIAETLTEKKSTVEGWVSEKRQSSDFGQPPASRQHFDVWNFQTADGDSSYFGKMPPQVVENLLWLYTDPGAVIVDPFAGGGTTIDVAKQMGRRVWASDRKPSTPTLPIHEHDIVRDGWPAPAPSRADFVLLDPPYWKQAAGRYSDDAEDIANVSLAEFMDAWQAVVGTCFDHLREGARLAFVISPSVDGEAVVDHAFAMYRVAEDIGLKPVRRVVVTYNTQQATGQQVTWAREKRQLLKLYRDLVVFER